MQRDFFCFNPYTPLRVATTALLLCCEINVCGEVEVMFLICSPACWVVCCSIGTQIKPEQRFDVLQPWYIHHPYKVLREHQTLQKTVVLQETCEELTSFPGREKKSF